MFKRVKKFLKEYKQLSFAIIVALTGAALSLAGYKSISNMALAGGAIIATIPLVIDMYNTLRHGYFGVDLLAATAIITSVILGEYWAAIVIVLMLTGGESLENYAERRAKRELTTLLSKRPKKAHLIKGRKITDISASKVNPGDKLSILPGEVIPVDATILEGMTSLDESSLTGESIPVTKTVGDVILSGSINLDGALTVKALHNASESQYEQIVKLVRNATSSQSPFVRMADRYSIPFTLISFFIAGAVWFTSGDPMRFLQVIVVATPCPLLLGAPIAIISGMSRASHHGVIIKNGTSLELLAGVKSIAFDKTGTITRGEPVVDKIKTFNGFDKSAVLASASALEQSSTHVLAKAITSEADKSGIVYKTAKQVTESSGHGLAGRINGKSVLVGQSLLLTEAGVEIPKSVAPDTAKQTMTYVAINGELAGVITFKDEIRPEAKPMLKRLRSAGLKQFALITGDNEAAAKEVAKSLNISRVFANNLPADKMKAIEQLNSPVAFVGDGVNDAPVLTTADVGIALGARGSTAASETADVVIMQDDISKVADSVEIAKRTLFIAKQSVMIGILISIGLMGVFATGKFKPIHGALIQEVVDIVVIVNALRAHGPLRHRATKS